jgi:hypothetical protein
MKALKIFFCCFLLSSVFISCKSLPPYESNKALFGILIDRDGVGKIGRMSENISLMNIETQKEFPSNAENFGQIASRNRSPFTVVALPAGRYRIHSIALGGSMFICGKECTIFEIVAGKTYYGGSYRLKISTGLGRITHEFELFETIQDESEQTLFSDFIIKEDARWHPTNKIERIKVFSEVKFSETRSSL